MMKRKKERSLPVRLFSLLVKLAIAAVILVVGINVYITKSTEKDIAASVDSGETTITSQEVQSFRATDPECIMVLGAAVKPDGTPCKMLRDRLDLGIALYKQGVAPKLLFSGDNGQVVYNEVNAMKKYAVNEGVPEEDIFLDHAGFSTYESVYRAKAIFDVDSMVVVTQRYHLYRALYGCRRMGITAKGAAAKDTNKGQELREAREIMARDKDFVKGIFKPQPTFMGETIPISGNGISTQ